MFLEVVILGRPIFATYTYNIATAQGLNLELCNLSSQKQIECEGKVVLAIGGVVTLPFGRGDTHQVGIVVGFSETLNLNIKSAKNVKSIISINYPKYFSEIQLQQLNWASNYYVTPLGLVYEAAIPNILTKASPLKQVIKRKQFIDELHIKLVIYLISVAKDSIAKKGLLEVIESKFKYLSLNDLTIDEKLAFSEKVASDPYLISTNFFKLIKNFLIEEDQNNFKNSSKSYQVALSSGVITKIETLDFESKISKTIDQIKLLPDWYQGLDVNLTKTENKHVLNEEQQRCYDQISSNTGFRVELIDGVTGSGKTEIYLQLIEQVIKIGKAVLVLVPEINLTPQTVSRFEDRFNMPIALLHSAINDKERLSVNIQAKLGKLSLIVGTRSAIFTDIKDLGLIILDEEHDSSYKQISKFNYHARDFAIYRGMSQNVPIVLGSATPSIVTYRNALISKYNHYKLLTKAENNFNTELKVINMLNQNVEAGISEELMVEIKAVTDAGDQVMLFLNRRGFATNIVCNYCGYTFTCGGCSRLYTYHRESNRLSCHTCSFTLNNVDYCPNCNSIKFDQLGVGTEKIEQLMFNYYLPEEVVRIDRDTTKNITSLNEKLEQITSGKAKVIIGTQMLAKGHHFHNLTMVAIINIDTYLKNITRNSLEQIAQLYAQVSGRAGRSKKKGLVVLQSRMVADPMFQFLVTKNYHEFIHKVQELEGNWKYSALIKLKCVNDSLLDGYIGKISQEIYNFIQDLNSSTSDIAVQIREKNRVNYIHICEIELSSSNRKEINIVLTQLQKLIESAPKDFNRVQIIFDVDPITD